MQRGWLSLAVLYWSSFPPGRFAPSRGFGDARWRRGSEAHQRPLEMVRYLAVAGWRGVVGKRRSSLSGYLLELSRSFVVLLISLWNLQTGEAASEGIHLRRRAI